MNKKLIIGLAAASGLVIGTLATAGGFPNTARTTTHGIAGGTSSASIPSSIPYSARASKRNNKSSISDTNFSGRTGSYPSANT